MSKPLRVLIVEDVEEDALLVVLALEDAGFAPSVERVETPEAMAAALKKGSWDLVLSDYSLPRFSAPKALALVKEMQLDLPFIIVSGTIGEEIAVESLRAGAHDFMAKGRLARLGPAVERELREAALRAEQARMREHLVVSERLASVGTLAAGIAHELNNPLTPLMANLTFIAEDVAQLSELTAAIDGAAGSATGDLTRRMRARLDDLTATLRDTKEAAERVRNIVRDLKVFSRVDETRTDAVDVRTVIESSARIAWNEIRHRARLVKDYGDVPLVQANQGRLGQVVLNLIVNAAQAIPEGHAQDNEIRISTRLDDSGGVAIAVSDTGSGIAEGLLGRIFEPFFTTKPVGIGTGLGLSVCHRIVTSLGGRLTVESQVGKGSTFRAVLPVARRATERPSDRINGSGAAARRGRILLIDDEPAIGMIVKRMLATEHEVVTMVDARSALVRVMDGERFDVILCDLMMPQMTGMDVHDELVRVAPDQAQRVVFITGGAFTARARQFLDEIPNQRIEKPFEPVGLRAVVQRVMG